MRVVITGGTGFIGRILSRMLAGQGHEIVVLTRRPRPAPAGKPSASAREGRSGGTVEHVGWDGRTDRGWGHLAEDAAVVNLAGESIASGRWSAEKKRDIVESRLAPERPWSRRGQCQTPRGGCRLRPWGTTDIGRRGARGIRAPGQRISGRDGDTMGGEHPGGGGNGRAPRGGAHGGGPGVRGRSSSPHARAVSSRPRGSHRGRSGLVPLDSRPGRGPGHRLSSGAA